MALEAPGLFGKLPQVGDFVSRRLPRSFLDPWDHWLQGALSGSREQLGDNWLADYLTSPIWRFALSADLAGPVPYTGIIMPSVDKAGRYFPLTLATALPGETNLFQLAGTAHDWYDAAESIALSVLDEPPPEIDLLDSQVVGLGQPDIPVSAGDEKPGDSSESVQTGNWHVQMRSVDALTDILPVIIQQLAGMQFVTYSVWWSAGSEQIVPSTLVCAELPSATGFAAMLDGNWHACGWHELPSSTASSTTSRPETVGSCQ